MTNKFPVPQEAVESGLLNSVNGNMEHWLQCTFFVSEDFTAHREVFQFIRSYLSQYGTLPSSSQISTRFQWNPPVGDFAYWLAEMKRYSLARKVLEVVQEGYNKISEPDQALSVLMEKLSVIRSLDNNHIQATDSSASERLETFDARTEYVFNAKSLLGLRTGMKIIDNTLVGHLPGSLMGVFARPGVGKTWWLLWQGVLSWCDGKVVLNISPEMPANMQNLRVDVIAGAEMGIPIDYNQLLVGDPQVRPNYEIVTKAMSQSQRWWSYDSLNDRPISISDVSSLIRQHQPDLVLIDGVSLLRSESSGQQWERMKDNIYGLKNIATIQEVPIIVTHQAVNSNRGRRTEHSVFRGDDDLMPSLSDAAFGDSFVQACSDIITMCGEPQSQYINWYSIRKHRERGWQTPPPSRIPLAVNFAKGKIVDMSVTGYSPDSLLNEARRLLGI